MRKRPLVGGYMDSLSAGPAGLEPARCARLRGAVERRPAPRPGADRTMHTSLSLHPFT